jgi:DNA polymerase-4
VVKLRLANFTTITRSRTLPEPTDVARQIYVTACGLYAAAGLDPRARLRLVGVRAAGLIPVARSVTQLALGEQPASWRDAEQAVDRIAGRFGHDSVRPAALVSHGGEAGAQMPAGPDRSPAPWPAAMPGGKLRLNSRLNE